MAIQQGRILTAEQLLVYRSKTEKILPLIGSKEFSPTFSWLETKQIQSALDERKQLLEEERVERLGSLAVAEWKEEVRLACVTRRVGRYFETLGHEQDATLTLHPEEALYLLETNCLELLHGGVAMSVQQGYNTLLGSKSDCSLEEYQVYSHLLRQGYRLLRHSPKVRATRYECQIGLHHRLLGSKQRYAKQHSTREESIRVKNELILASTPADVFIKEDVKIEPHNIAEFGSSRKEKDRKCKINDHSSAKRLRIAKTSAEVKSEIEIVDVNIEEDTSIRRMESESGVEVVDISMVEDVNRFPYVKKEIEVIEISVEDNTTSVEHIKREVEIVEVNTSKSNFQTRNELCTSELEIIGDSNSAVVKQWESSQSGFPSLQLKNENTDVNESLKKSVNSAVDDVKQIITELLKIVVSRCEAAQQGEIPVVRMGEGKVLLDQSGPISQLNTICNYQQTSALDSLVPIDLDNHERVKEEEFQKPFDSDQSVNSDLNCSKESDKSECFTNPGLSNSIDIVENKFGNSWNGGSDNCTLDTFLLNTETETQDDKVIHKLVDITNDVRNRKPFLNQEIIEISDNSMSSIAEIKPEIGMSDNSETSNQRNSSDKVVKTELEGSSISKPYLPQGVLHNYSQSINSKSIRVNNFETNMLDQDEESDLVIIKCEAEPIEIIEIVEDEVTDITPVYLNNKLIHKRLSSEHSMEQRNDSHWLSKRRKSDVESNLMNAIPVQKVTDDASDKVKNESICKTEMDEELSKFYEAIELVDLEETEEKYESEDRRQILDSFPNMSGLLVVNLTVPPSKYIPENITPEKNEYVIHLWRLREPGIGGYPETIGNERARNFTRRRNYQRNGGYHRSRHSRKRNTFPPTFGHRRHRSPQRSWQNNETASNTYQPSQPWMQQQDRERFMSQSGQEYPPIYPMNQFAFGSQMELSFTSQNMQQSWPYPWNNMQANSPRVDQRSETVLLRREGESEMSRFIDNGERVQLFELHDQRYVSNSGRNSMRDTRRNHPRFNNSRYNSPSRKQRSASQRVWTERNESNEYLSSFSINEHASSWADLKQRLNNNVHISPTLPVFEETEIIDDQLDFVEPIEQVKEELDTVEVTPLLCPADCTSIDNILNKLNIIKPVDCSTTELSLETRIEINYDLYLPNTLFRKSNPPLPDFRLVILGYETSMPSLGSIAVLMKNYEDGVPLLIAVVLPDSISFFHYAVINLPTYSESP